MSLIRGRFRKPADRLAARYTASVGFDCRLYPYDIAGSIAHARMLARQGIISPGEAETIAGGLAAIREDIEQGRFEFEPALEDVHMNIEAALIKRVGEVGGKLHTARSRNDQVALDLRLYAREAIKETLTKIRRLQTAVVDLAEANKGVPMPGFTHLQPAQPVLFAHHLLAYFEMLSRDAARFQGALERVDVMPLGSGALAGVTYPVDRESVARELGFSRVSGNSLDAVSDRDFVLEYESAAAVCMMHLSRLAEEIVLWSSPGFDFIEVDDAFATSSSIMPQKKNPDVAELARGKTGRVYGALMALLTAMKGLPLAYNRDMQEDKEGFFDTVDTLQDTLDVFTGMAATLRAKPENMLRALERGYILATELADYLAKKGVPFREAHGIVARLVSYAAAGAKPLSGLSLKEYRDFSPLFEEDVRLIDVGAALAARNVTGGTAAAQVEKALAAARKALEEPPV